MNEEKLKELQKGDEVLVDVKTYLPPGVKADSGTEEWCRIVRVVGGTATRYPLRVSVPGAGLGQFKYSEVIDYRKNGRNQKVKVFLDSGANIHSEATAVVTLDELDVSSMEEWEALDPDDQFDMICHFFPNFCWGVKPLKD